MARRDTRHFFGAKQGDKLKRININININI